MDITQLILDDHDEQRRLFAIVEQLPREGTDTLQSMWERLAALLEVHAEAEERFFYPMLLRRGRGAGEKDTAEDETEDAIEDHNEIRDAVAQVVKHPTGSDEWFDAIEAVNKANGDHMAEEERQGLTDFRRTVTLQQRHDLAISFVGFEAAHVTGVKAVNKDPEEYIAEHG